MLKPHHIAIMRILLVEDNKSIADFIKKGLKEESYTVDHTVDGEEGILFAETNNYDLIILDIMLPTIDGIKVCREIRKKGIVTPIMMLTAKNTVEDKVSGLESGADDYITKPFSFDEFTARIHALFRRKQSKIIELSHKELKIDVFSHRVFVRDTEVNLRAKEYAILLYLLSNKGRILSRTQILENVWGYNYDPTTNIVDVYIMAIRKKLRPFFDEEIIRTVRGMGYLIEDD